MAEQLNPDQRYIQALKERNPVLCQEIYNLFLPKVIAMIRAKGGTTLEAQDIFQQAILAILLKLKVGEIKLKSSFLAYLKGICFNKFIDLCNAQKRKLRNEDELRLSIEALLDSADIEQLLIKEKQWNLFWQCFKQLSEICQTIIMGKINNFKAIEIMKKINFTKPVNAFYQKRFDCMRKLRLLIEQNPNYKKGL